MQKVSYGNSGRYFSPDTACAQSGSEISTIQLRNNDSGTCTDFRTLRALHNKYMTGSFPQRNTLRQTNEQNAGRNSPAKGSYTSLNSSNPDAHFLGLLGRTKSISTEMDRFYMSRYRKEQRMLQEKQRQEEELAKHLSNQASAHDMNEGIPKNETNEHKFPFTSTSSGNLKVKNNQVVFDSKRISVLVADPKSTQVKITDSKNSKSGPIDQYIAAMQKDEINKNTAIGTILNNHHLGTVLSSLMLGGLPGAPSGTEKELSHYENKATHEILSPELTLARLGCHAYLPIEWSQINLPEKKNLYVELYIRVTNFINADCKIFIDHEEFNCHLLVLQCYSEVFHAYIAVKRVDIASDKCDAPSFAFIYEWMISGDPSYTELRRGNVLDIFTAAKYLKIKDLVEQCWAFMDNASVFAEANAFLLYIAAKHKNLPDVRQLMLPRIEKFFMMLVASEDWLYLDADDVVTFLDSNYVCLNCEMEIFMAAVRWLKFDWEGREKFKRQVLGCVRFGNISPWQLVDIKRNSDNPEFYDLARDPEICKMIDDGLAYVIIKYWYGQENEDFKHWNSILALKDPPQRNWSGIEKTYFTYREFLIYLDIFRRNLLEEQKKDQEETELRVTDISTRHSSIEKVTRLPIIGKAPTTDEFMRGSLSKSTSKKGRSLRHQLLSRLPQTDQKKKHHKKPQIKQSDAAKIIERAYLHYKFTRSIHGLSKRLQNSSAIRESKLISRFYDQKKTMANPIEYVPQHNTQIFSIFLQQQRRQEADRFSNISSSYRRRELLVDGSLYHMEHESVLVFGGINGHTGYGLGRNTGKDIYRYLPVQNDWEFVGELPAPRTHHGVGYLNGRVYVIGGSDPRIDQQAGKTSVVDTVWSFDPVKRIWFSESSLNMKRKIFGTVVYGKYIFAIGGQDKHTRVTNLVERYDPANTKWEYVAPMKHSRMGVASAKFEEKIWVAGGMCGSNNFPITDCVECYDVAANQWTEITKLRVPRCFCTFAVVSNNLYLVAGAGHSPNSSTNTFSINSIDMYMKKTDRWEEHSQMEVSRHGHTTAYLGTQIIIIGGVTTIYMRALSTIECYCTTRETWIRGMASLPISLTGHATCTLPPAALLQNSNFKLFANN